LSHKKIHRALKVNDEAGIRRKRGSGREGRGGLLGKRLEQGGGIPKNGSGLGGGGSASVEVREGSTQKCLGDQVLKARLWRQRRKRDSKKRGLGVQRHNSRDGA